MAKTKQYKQFIIPEDLSWVKNRAQAEDVLMEIFQANRKTIIGNLIDNTRKLAGKGVEIELPEDWYDTFAENVLDKMSVKYGGYDPRTRIKKNGKYIDNDVDFEEALMRTLRSPSYTPYTYTAKRNFLKGIKDNYANYWNFLQKNMRAKGPGDYYEGIDLDDVIYDEASGSYLVRLFNGRIIRFVHERGPNGSPEWRAYDEGTGELLQI